MVTLKELRAMVKNHGPISVRCRYEGHAWSVVRIVTKVGKTWIHTTTRRYPVKDFEVVALAWCRSGENSPKVITGGRPWFAASKPIAKLQRIS